MWDEKTRKEIERRIDRELTAELEIAESAPFPPPELAEQGVYCEGCHEIEAVWNRPKDEVMPPKSSVDPVWKLGAGGNVEQGESRGTSAAGTVTAGGRVSTDAKPHFEAPAKSTQKSKPAKAVASKSSAKKSGARKKRS